MAGTRIWLGVSCASCTIMSARSVSMGSIPAAIIAGLRSISSVVIDLILMTRSASCRLAMFMMISRASSASRAQCTTPPAAVTLASNCKRCVSSSAMAAVLMAAPASRSASQSGSSAVTRAVRARMVVVALRILRRIWVLRRAIWASAGKLVSVIIRPRFRPGFRRDAWPEHRFSVVTARRRYASGRNCRLPLPLPRRFPAPRASCR